MLQRAIETLKKSVANPISLSAGADLFLRFVLRNIHDYQDWGACKKNLVENGRLFAQRAKESRTKIAEIGLQFIRDDDVILVNGRSRAVAALLQRAAQHRMRFRVYITEARIGDQGSYMCRSLQGYGIPICPIADSAVGYVIDKVDKVFIGAEGVAESGGVISNMGTYQNTVLAKNANKPVYVFAESHKFVRSYPLSPSDVSNTNELKFSVDPEPEKVVEHSPEADFTPHQYITALITDLGVLTPSGVSEELIKIWFD